MDKQIGIPLSSFRVARKNFSPGVLEAALHVGIFADFFGFRICTQDEGPERVKTSRSVLVTLLGVASNDFHSIFENPKISS